MSALEVVVGRQPIFDRALSVIGYELLFRPLASIVNVDTAGPRGDEMTADVLLGSLNIGIERLVGIKLLFCNGSRGVLTGDVPIVLEPAQTVIEILETIRPEAEILEGCHRLHDQGFALALDDVTSFEEVVPFIDVVSIVKVDIRAIDPSGLPALVEQCQRVGTTLVAEKVETFEELERSTSLGFDYFQGFFLARPSHVPGRTLDSQRLAQLQLAVHLLDSECPVSELDAIVRSDPGMSLQLLRLAGLGASHGLRRTIQTIQEALVLVGWRRLQSWVALVLIGGRGHSSEEEMTVALSRARMCQILAEKAHPASADMAFTAGMLSSFDVLLGIPLEEVLSALPLTDSLRNAVLDGEGPIGPLVYDVIDYQLGRPEAATRSNLQRFMPGAAIDALMWSVATIAAAGTPAIAE